MAPVAAASGRAQKCYQTQGSGKNFHFHLGIYLKIDAAAIVAPVAAASGRTQKCFPLLLLLTTTFYYIWAYYFLLPLLLLLTTTYYYLCNLKYVQNCMQLAVFAYKQSKLCTVLAYMMYNLQSLSTPWEEALLLGEQNRKGNLTRTY